MDEDPSMQPVDPAMVKYLRVLVTALTATMIIGFIIITALFVTRFTGRADVTLPVSITLPEGARATAFTQGGDWYAVVTETDEILIFDRMTGQLRQSIRIEN